MNIVTVIHDFRGGGAERVSVLLANAFARQGHRSELVCLSEAGPYRDLVDPAVAVTCLHKQRMFEAVSALAGIMRAAPQARVLSHLTHVNVVTLVAALVAGHKLVWCVEHNDFHRAAADAPSILVRAAYSAAPWLYRRARSVFCVSDSVRDSIPGATAASERFTVVANPLDPLQLADGCAKAVDHPWLSGGYETLVACGRLAAQKNYPMMLDAVARLRKHRDIRLVVLGQGPDREALVSRAAALGIADAVDFAGFSANPFAMFARARLFVSTSDYEGLPMTVIEALYSGADVVTTDSCSGVADLTAGAGFGACVPRGDLDAFVGAVEARLAIRPVPVNEKRKRLATFEIGAVAGAYLAVLGR
jgi:glycosyltransferase involved in cell wall biosynthesis